VDYSRPAREDGTKGQKALQYLHSLARAVCSIYCTRAPKPGNNPATGVFHKYFPARHHRKLRWDPKKWQFVGDDKANEWLDRPRRNPWQLPKV
jgi:hypothetical protein